MRVLGNFSVEGNTSAALDYIVSLLFVERLGIKDLPLRQVIKAFFLLGSPERKAYLSYPCFFQVQGAKTS